MLGNLKLAAEIAKLVIEGWSIHGNEKRAREAQVTNERIAQLEARIAELETKKKRGSR